MPTTDRVEDDQEEKVRQLTLDEYKQQQQAKFKPKPEKNLRKGGENEDQSKWKNTKVLEREDDVASDNAKVGII